MRANAVSFRELSFTSSYFAEQDNDFDAQIADTTITMIQYILLTLNFRFEHYETKGVLFQHVKKGIIQSRLNERLWGLFIELMRVEEVLFDEIHVFFTSFQLFLFLPDQILH